MEYIEHDEVDQDKFVQTYEMFRDYNTVIYPDQLKIYQNIANFIKGKQVLEVGCGMGIGTAILERGCDYILGTDKVGINVAFAKALYPWIDFDTLNISNYNDMIDLDVTVAIEVIEHVKKYKASIKNLIDRTKEELWISTPNRNNKDINNNEATSKEHIKEFTPKEMLEMIGDYRTEILHWDTFKKLDINTMVSPLVYRIYKRSSIFSKPIK